MMYNLKIFCLFVTKIHQILSLSTNNTLKELSVDKNIYKKNMKVNFAKLLKFIDRNPSYYLCPLRNSMYVLNQL